MYVEKTYFNVLNFSVKKS